MDGETEQSAFDELVEMERQSGLEAPEIPDGVDTEIMRQPLVYEDPAEPATRAADVVTAGSTHPLKLYKDNDGSTQRVSVVYGTIGGLELDTYGPVTITATRYFFGKLTTTSGGAPSTLELIDQASVTPPAETDTEFYIYLGRAVVASGEITGTPDSNLRGSQQVARCGYTANYTLSHWLV